jgi:hypothetical protein
VDQLFAENFMEKLKEAATPIFSKILEERAGGGKHEKFLKYKKTFLMELMDVKKFGPTAQIYDTYVAIGEVNLKLNSFQQAYAKIDFDSPSEDAVRRARELQRMAEEYRDQLHHVPLSSPSSSANSTKASGSCATSARPTSPASRSSPSDHLSTLIIKLISLNV